MTPPTETVALPDTLRLGPTHLTVSDLDGSIAFYENALGLQVHDRENGTAALGAGGEDLLVLTGEPGAELGGRSAGLYHYALLYPSREELARALQRLANTRTRIEGAADHGVSEAIYLRDPDDNGIELYADRPRDAWPEPSQPGERVGIYTIGLDLKDLLSTIAGEDPAEQAGEGVQTGHLHLHVGDIDEGLAFYRDILGFEVMVNLGSAAFVSAGGYHHHLGFNVWLGRDVKPNAPGMAGLRHWTVFLERPEEIAAVRARADEAGIDVEETASGGFLVRDPWQIGVAFERAPAAASA
ncbi:MAG: catechol 2,3-dioxygenase [Solirubrobacteraceae bacterium]|jgi:catechol 2,3-dioxygenase|nr:catechol 2,3-dioxygenase [Solirubrobacteraceae bacterium]